MTDQEVLAMYKPLVTFLARLCGSGSEVVLHDVSKPKGSVIAIANGSHSNRVVGAPMTDLAVRVQAEELYRTQDSLDNYKGTSKGKHFLSSTYFIKNEDRLIGLLCINRDTTAINALDAALRVVKQQYNLEEGREDIQETLGGPVAEMMRELVEKAVVESGIPATRMSREEKIVLVQKLNAQGVMTMKGAVPEIARQLFISEPTVYRYMNRKD